MTDAMFTEAEVYHGDPLRPDLETPTPLEVVASLAPAERRQRLDHLITQASAIYDEAVATYAAGREIVASLVLFSGGNDSTTLAHMFRHRATHALMANTTIGIEQTRQYVRDTCAGWGLPLIEKLPPQTYEELIVEKVDGIPRGFPGPGMHFFAYARLKERAFDLARHDLGIANSRTKCAVFIAGRRRQESDRREDVPLHESDGSVIWASPLAMWTKLDLLTYREVMGDVPRNEVSDLLHMSGECLCGAYAHRGELDEIGTWFPEVRAEIERLERVARAAGVPEPYCNWGHGVGAAGKKGRLCSSCKFSAPIEGQLTLGDATA